MSNVLVEQLRRAYPTKTAGRSDADLTVVIADRLAARGDLDHYRAQHSDFEADLLNVRNAGGDVLKETGVALKAGLMDRLPGSFESAGALGADALARSEGLANLGLTEPLTRAGDYLRGLARENKTEAAQRVADAGGRTISRVEDIRLTKPRDYILWALPSAAENIPSMLPSLGAGAVGFGLGGPPGAIAAAGAVSIAQNAGDVYGELDEPGVPRDRAITAAIAAGIPMGVLDVVGELLPLAKGLSFFKGATKKATASALENILTKVGSLSKAGGLKGAGIAGVQNLLTEGSTETMQEIVQMAGEKYATGKEHSAEEIRTRLINSAAAGGLLGGVTGAVFGLVPERAEAAVTPPAPPPPPAPPFGSAANPVIMPPVPPAPNLAQQASDALKRAAANRVTDIEATVVPETPLPATGTPAAVPAPRIAAPAAPVVVAPPPPPIIPVPAAVVPPEPPIVPVIPPVVPVAPTLEQERLTVADPDAGLREAGYQKSTLNGALMSPEQFETNAGIGAAERLFQSVAAKKKGNELRSKGILRPRLDGLPENFRAAREENRIFVGGQEWVKQNDVWLGADGKLARAGVAYGRMLDERLAEWIAYGERFEGDTTAGQTARLMDSGLSIRKAHEMQIRLALQNKNPVNAEAIDAYGTKLPDGYSREGDQYIYRSPKTSPAIAALAADTGTTPAAIKAQSETTADLVPMPPAAAPKVVVAPSKIEGQGVIAVAPIAVGEVVAPATVEGGGRTPAGRNVNHAEPRVNVAGPTRIFDGPPPPAAANANLVQTGGGKVDIVAKVPIAPGTEVTVDYRETSGPLSIADPNPAPTGHEDASLAIAIVAPDGKVHVFNASRGSVKADGTRDTMVHNTADLVPKKGTGKNRGLAQLTAAGWKLKQGPFKMAAERPNLHLVMTEAEFAAQVEQSNTAANVVVESITQGRGDALAEQWLKANDAPGWAAFEWLRNKIAADTGVAPSHVGIGLATAANSVAKRAGLQAKTVLEKMKAGDVLRRTGSKIFVQLTDAQSGDIKNAVAEGKGDEFIEKHFSKDGAVPSEQARSRYDTWALNMGELGVKDQAGGDAHVTGVETQVDENTAAVAAPEVTEEAPLSLGESKRAALAEMGFDEKLTNTVLALMLAGRRGTEIPTRNDVALILATSKETKKWMDSIKKKGAKTTDLGAILDNLTKLYEDAQAGTTGKLRTTDGPANQPGGVRPDGGPARAPGSGELKSQPALPDARWRASDPDVARRIAAGLSFLRDAGITVEVIQAAMDAAAGAVQAVGGSYSVAQRTMQLAMSSLTNPSATDLELLIHEAVHAMFPSMPPDIRAAVHRAVAKMPASGRLDPARNLSLQESDPAVRAEERLAVFMEGEGIRPGDAKDVASSLIRFFKDLYLKVARALAMAFGQEAYADKLALRYFTSRLNGLMQGDAAPNSLINALGGRSLRFQEMAAVGAGIGRELGQVVDGQMLWAPKVPDTLEAQEFNTRLAFSEPVEDESEIPQLRSEFKHSVAQIKETLDRLTAPMTEERAQRIAQKRGLTLAQFKEGRAGAIEYWRAHQAAMEKEGIRFSRPVPIPQTPAGPYNPAVKINREVAIYNHGITVETAVGAALTANAPAAAAEAARANLPITEWFRRILHVESPEALRARQLARIDPLTQQPPPGLNPAATFADIKDAKIALETKYRAYEYLERIQRAVSKTLTTTLGDLQPALNRLQKAKDAFLEEHKRYENERGLSRIIELGVRKMIRRERKLGLRIGEQMGVVMQQLRQLDTRDADIIDREYGEVFKKLFDGPELRGHNLFEFLDQMVNEAGIDFDGLTIAEIQRKLADRVAAGMTTPEIGMLVGGDPRSRALLSTVVAWAKLDESGSTRANLARRRITNLAERMALQERLDKFIAEQDITDQALRDLVKSTKLEERTKVAYYRHKKKVMALDAAAKELQLKIDAASAALPVYREALGELQKDAGARPEYSFIDGEQYPVPTQNSKGEWEFPLQTLSLNSTSPDGITDSDLVARQVAEMSAWLRMMESTQTYGWRYFDVLAARDMLSHAVYESAPRRTQKWISNNLLAPIGDVARATGTAAGRLFAQSVGVFVGIETSNAAQGTRLGRAVDRTRDRAIAVLNRGRAKGSPKMTGARYMATVAEPALYILDGYATTDLREDVMLTEQQKLSRGMQRVINTLLQDPYTRDFVRGKEQAVADAVLAHSRAREEASAFGNSINAKHNVGVRDERIIVPKSSGDTGAAIRDSNLGVGVITVSKTWSAMVERVYRALTANGWASMREAIPDIVDAYRQGGGASGVRAWLAQNPERAKWFTPDLMNDIAGAMALNPGTGLFDTPVLADGVTRGEADPELSAQAWRASPDVWDFFDRMFDAHHGVSDRGQYVGEMLEKMHELWRKVGVSLDPNVSGAVPDDLSRLTSDLMINARTAMRFPQPWTKHLEFDSTQMHGLIRRIASQAAFGRESSGAAAMYATMQAEVKKVTETLDKAIEQLEARSIEGKDQRRALEAQFGKEELARMERMSALGRRLEAEKHKFRSYFRKDDTTFDHNNWISALGAFITNGLLQTPVSMLNNLADTFAPLVSGGGVSQSTLRQVGRTWKEIGHDFASGMAEMVGLQLGASSVEGALYSEERFNDSANTLQLIGRTEDGMTSDIASAMRSSDASWFTNALQAWTRTAGAAITPLGEKATATGIRPFAPFTYGIMSTTRASVISTWQRVGDMVVQGMEYFSTHRADANNPNFKLTASNLGLTGTEAAAYEVFSTQMSEGYGLEITSLTREAMARGKGPKDRRALLSPLTRALLTGFVSKHLTLDATVDSMTTSAWTSTPLRFLLPLWGWSMRRAMQVTGVPFDAEGRFRVQALGRGLVGLALLATSGFAMALMADEYFERIVGKKRNIRSLKSLPSTLAHGQFGEAFLTATENLNRAGTFGIWGEILNTGVNGLAEGGDNRTISLDSRVVMMSSMLGVAKAFSTLAATRDLDYTSVVRPFIMALGGNSALHYNQLANRALGLDTAESRFVERTSVQNELRVAGREIGLAVRAGGRGSEGADAMTPILSRMVLATYAGDRADFLDQWRSAVRQAREMGKEDPVSYVKDRFAARNPLKNVFQHISQDEYAKLIRSRDNDSRQRISGALNRFNAYAESLDAKAYTGSVAERGRGLRLGGGDALRQLRGF